KGTVSRFSNSEDTGDRTMRTEIDLDNKDGKLRAGMYGGVTIVLSQAEENALTIPAKALIEQDGAGSGSVYVVENGKVRKKNVQIGSDNGVNVEVISGLNLSDEVVVNYNGSIADGLAVKTEKAKLEKPLGSSHG
ncbi:MAG TPA: efflux RND transporter periplasmic adaptor subunit, partial [Isosphaeraceae bacterium]|nr:efflux RND transporter periplasmic adaptor subunit [Isosphaeraceae bacterium]